MIELTPLTRFFQSVGTNSTFTPMSLASSLAAGDVRQLRERYPGVPVVSYVNTSAAVKAESDICCTSANAVKMVQHFEGRPLIFAPDRHLARFVGKEAGRDDLIVWQGACIVHELFSAKGLAKLKIQHPDADVLAHPECDQAVLDQADFIASTTGIIQRAVAFPDRESC